MYLFVYVHMYVYVYMYVCNVYVYGHAFMVYGCLCLCEYMINASTYECYCVLILRVCVHRTLFIQTYLLDIRSLYV